MAGALDGITVIDLTDGAAGALATLFLADHGARVIRVIDTPSRLLRDGGFRVWDRGKQAVLLAPDDAAALDRLLLGADIVVEDFAPAARPARLGAASLRAAHPRLIVASITAYGETGPLANEPPIDDLVLARLGVLAGLPGFRDGPVHAAHPLPSVGAGILAALGCAAALYDREATGHGRHVETSLVAGALLYHPKVVGDRVNPVVFQTNPYGSAPFYSVYECADGEWLQLGCVHHGFIARAADLMSIADVLDDPVYDGGHTPKTPEADRHLRGIVREVMLTRPAADWIADFEARDIPFARSQTNDAGMDDPQVAHNGMLVTLDDPAVGPMQVMAQPVKMSATPARPQGPRAAAATPVADIIGKQPPTPAPAPPPSSPPQLPLAGVRVLEITNLIAGPIAGRLLADIGADVIKLEPPTGDISRPIGRTYFYSVNYAKRSIAVDTAKPEGKAIVQRVAATCDVLLANLRPGATARMGIGNAADADLVETQISGYGFDGPYAHRPGIDPMAQALIGLERAQGGAGNPPSFTAQLAPTDFTTGTMAAFGTVLALYARRRGASAGQRVEVNLLDGGIVLSSEWFTRYAGRPERPLADTGQHGPEPFHRLYACCDGYLYVAADTPAARTAFVAAMGLGEPPPETDTPGDVHPNDTPFGVAAAAAFARLDRAAATARLAEAGIPCAPALPGESTVFFADPHTAVNGWSVTCQHPWAGALTAVCRYLRFDGTGTATDGIQPTPLLGQQTDAVLAEAGYTADDIAALRRDDLVVTRTEGP